MPESITMMGVLSNRFDVLSKYLIELLRFGLPEQQGEISDEVLIILDGVGRFQAAPLMVRRMLRNQGIPLPTIYYSWQFGLPGEIWTDLMWLRRNRRVARSITRKIIQLRRDHPHTKIHLLAYSGGAGLAVFALENLRGVSMIETLLLACPTLSPEYDLSPALRCVKQGYALVSEKDTFILGMGTKLFGTTDRKFLSAGGCVGFRKPNTLSVHKYGSYDRFCQIRWSPALKEVRHHGGHTGYVTEAFLSRHLMGLLRGDPDLFAEPIPSVVSDKVRE